MSELVVAAYDRTDTQGVADSVMKYLRREHGYEVVVVGPGHPRVFEGLDASELERARFFLELDAISGRLHHTEGLGRLACPKLAWFVDSHKKPQLHQRIASEFDHVFFTMRSWAGLFGERGRWLPVHFDEEWFSGREEVEPTFDVGFVGSQPHERTRGLQEIAARRGLSLLLETTTGPREKERTADLYARCRIVFNQHVANDLNFRVVEALACRRLLLTDAQRNGQYELFQDRKHLVYYKDDADLEAQLVHFLEHPDERERIAGAGHALVWREHTTAQRVRAIVAAAEEHVLARGAPARRPEAALDLPRLTGSSWAKPLLDGLTLADLPGRSCAAAKEPVLTRTVATGREATPDVSIMLVSCDRPMLLERTLRSTRAALARSKHRIEWLAFDNGSAEEARRIVETAGLDVVLRAERNLGLAPALDALDREARGRHLLVLEDDWECLCGTSGWLERAVAILDGQPDVGVVRLRRLDDRQTAHARTHRREVALVHHPWSIEPLPDVVETRLIDGEPYYVASSAYANWTHNPALCRREVREWLGPPSAYLPDPRDHCPSPSHPGLEGAIDLRWRLGPWKVAKLLDGPFTHTGDVSARVAVGAP